jgi:hypothetical protein
VLAGKGVAGVNPVTRGNSSMLAQSWNDPDLLFIAACLLAAAAYLMGTLFWGEPFEPPKIEHECDQDLIERRHPN